MKKLYIRLVLVVFVCAVSMTAIAEEITLTVWNTGGDEDCKILDAASLIFQKQNPGVMIECQPISWNDAHAKMLAATASGEGPDLLTGGLSWGIEFGEMGGMIDLNDYPEVMEAVKKYGHQKMMQSVTSLDGSVYGVPYDMTLMLMYYRPDVLEAAGAPNPPKTWDEMTQAIEKLHAAGKQGFLMAWGNPEWLQYFNFLYQAGGRFYDDACTKATINSPEGLTALEFFTNLHKKYNISTEGWPDIEGGLENESVGFAYTGSWVFGNLDTTRPDMAGKWSIGMLPAGPAGNSIAFTGGRIIGVMSFSPNADAAAQFIGSLYTPAAAETMIKTAESLGRLHIPPMVEFIDLLNQPKDRKQVLAAQIEESYAPPNCPGWEEAGNEVTRQIQEVIFNDVDPQAALDKAAEAMNAGLE